jgi:Ca2+-binding EF-hand superfamily protein
MRFAALVFAPLLLGASLGSALLAQETRASAAAKFAKEFAATDTNHDGVWSRDELQARITGMGTGAKKIDAVHAKRLADLWFDRADTNKDGKVTQAEAQALLAAMMQRYNAARNAGTPAGPPTR